MHKLPYIQNSDEQNWYNIFQNLRFRIVKELFWFKERSMLIGIFLVFFWSYSQYAVEVDSLSNQVILQSFKANRFRARMFIQHIANALDHRKVNALEIPKTLARMSACASVSDLRRCYVVVEHHDLSANMAEFPVPLFEFVNVILVCAYVLIHCYVSTLNFINYENIKNLLFVVC